MKSVGYICALSRTGNNDRLPTFNFNISDDENSKNTFRIDSFGGSDCGLNCRRSGIVGESGFQCGC